MISLPQTCHFCGEEITKYGMESKSLTIHSLDGCHENMDPANKVPCHKGCHQKYHRGKDSVETNNAFTTIRIPQATHDALTSLLIHWRQPLYEIITKLLEGKTVE